MTRILLNRGGEFFVLEDINSVVISLQACNDPCELVSFTRASGAHSDTIWIDRGAVDAVLP